MSLDVFNIFNPVPGEMNRLSKKGNLRAPFDAAQGTLYPLKQALNHVYSQANNLSYDRPWDAICLHATKMYSEDVNTYSLSRGLGLSDVNSHKVGYLLVKARIPALHQLLLWPSSFPIAGDDSDMSDIDKLKLSLYPTFISRLDNNIDIPAPSDRIQVDFEDRHRRIFGIYLGVEERGTGTIPDNVDGVISSTEASSAFEDSSSSMLGD
jgi:hypothetical protein|tara:strand:- start:15722 stop:16348 length:627 start_codon:yes stop_codon:yes gene_type:complete